MNDGGLETPTNLGGRLCGGDKRAQQRDIKRAQMLAAELKE